MKPTKKTRKNRMKGGMDLEDPASVGSVEKQLTRARQRQKRPASSSDALADALAADALAAVDYRQRKKPASSDALAAAAHEDQSDNICNEKCIEEIAEAVVQKLKESHDVKVVVTPPDELSELEKMQSLVDNPTTFKSDHEYSELFKKYLKAYMLENYGRFNSIEESIVDFKLPPSPLEPEVIIKALKVRHPREDWPKFFELYSSGPNQQIKEYFDMVNRYEKLCNEAYLYPESYLSKAALQDLIDKKTEKNKKIDKIMRMVNNLQYFEIHYIITKDILNDSEFLDKYELILESMTKIELILSSNTYVSSNVRVSKDENIQIVLLIKLYLICVYSFSSNGLNPNIEAVSENCKLLLSLKYYLNMPRFSPLATGLPVPMNSEYDIKYNAIFANPTPLEIIKALQLEMNEITFPIAAEAWKSAFAAKEWKSALATNAWESSLAVNVVPDNDNDNDI